MNDIEQLPVEILTTLAQIDVPKYRKYLIGGGGFQMLKQYNWMVAIGSHDLCKELDWKYSQLMKELGKDHELVILWDKLTQAIADAGWAVSGRHYKGSNEKILKKYSHNIMSVIQDTQLLLSTKSEMLVKDEIGNKAYHLWQMAKDGLPVPDAFFLTFAASRMIHVAKNVVPAMFKDVMYYFNGEPVAIRSSGLESMPGMLETIYVGDSSDWEKVSQSIMQVVDSWHNDKAVKYRKICKIEDLMQIGVIVQKLVKADNANGFSGTAFSHDPVTGEHALNGEILKEQMGHDLASGNVTPVALSQAPIEIVNELRGYVDTLFNKYKKPQYVEFAYDGSKLYMLQCRDMKLNDRATAKFSLQAFKNGWLDSTRLERIYKDLFFGADSLRRYEPKDISIVPITKGIASSDGVISGKIKLNFNKSSSDEKYIWFTDITTTRDLERIKNIDGIVTTKGGYTSHPAEVSRMFKKPAIVSALGVEIFDDHVTICGRRFEEGDTVTIVGNTGDVYATEVEIESKFDEELDNEFKNALNNG